MNTRRKFFTTAVAAAATASISVHAQTVSVAPASPAPVAGGARTLKLQSAFSKSDARHKLTEMFAAKFNALSGDKLKLEVSPAGTVVSGNELLDAVSNAKLDGGFAAPSNWHTKNSAISLWASGPAFGMTSKDLGAWHQYGGGKELYKEVYAAMGSKIVSMPFSPVSTQPMGWFKKPLTRVEEFKGMKFRTNGLGVDVFRKLGATVVTLDAAGTIEAFKKGELDGAEFNNLSTDKAIGLATVAKHCVLQSYHEGSGFLEVFVNDAVWASMAPDQKALFETVTNAMFSESSWFMSNINSIDYDELAKSGVTFYTAPATLLTAQLNAWDYVIASKSSSDPLFAKIIKSQQDFARRYMRWSTDVEMDARKVYQHYFRRRLA